MLIVLGLLDVSTGRGSGLHYQLESCTGDAMAFSGYHIWMYMVFAVFSADDNFDPPIKMGDQLCNYKYKLQKFLHCVITAF